MSQAPQISNARMTRARLYTLIDAFEVDMRRLLNSYVLDHEDEETAVGALVFSRASARRDGDDGGESASITEYLDLQDAYDALNRNRDSLPVDLAREVRANTPAVNSLAPIRNRVMHGRPLAGGDADLVINTCELFVTRYWTTVSETLRNLVEDPTWQPAFEVKAKPSEKVLHNLPLADYDETGLVGRSADMASILKHLRRKREPIITVIGEGGIGKTAVALEAAYSLLDDPDCPFECILWVSLKTEKLTTGGVVQISDAVRDVAGAARTLGQAVINDFEGGVEDLASLLEGVETLLILDNLETISGAEVVTLYEELPDSVSYLFTSRVGVGQFERRVVLDPLSSRDAAVLFRSLAQSRGVQRLARLKSETLSEITTRLRCSPLAIRWYVLSVESGSEPLNLLSQQDELLEFCVRTVHTTLSRQAQSILSVLYALDRDSTFDELAILTDVAIDGLRRAVHDLLSCSLASLEPDNENQLVSRVRLTEVARHFLRRVSPPSQEVVEEVLGRERQLRESEEIRQADERKRLLAPGVVRVQNANEQPVAYLLRLALLESHKGNLEKSLEYVQRARELNAEYWEVDRVEGFILSSVGRIEQATALYRSGLRKADGEGAAVISYFFAGHLARKVRNLPEALDHARSAHYYFNAPETAQQLGNFLVWSDNFATGQEYLELALEGAVGRARLIALTSLVDSWRRWAEHLNEHDRQMFEAFNMAYAGYTLGAREIRSGVVDVRLANAVLECCSSCISATCSGGLDELVFRGKIVEMLELISDQHLLFEKSRSWTHFPGHVGRLLRFEKASATVRRLCENIINPAARKSPGEVAKSSIEYSGVIKIWNTTYGFISHVDFPGNVFFPGVVIENDGGASARRNLAGRRVRFKVNLDDPARPRATWVWIQPETS